MSMRFHYSTLAIVLMMPTPLLAQSEDLSDEPESVSLSAFSQSIIVTGTKKRGGQEVHDVPLSITAFGEAQLEAAFVTTLSDLRVPNTQLNTGGAVVGYAGFAIRGLGLNSTIPSIDPAVGVFVDGIYMGIPAGIVTDNFDLEAIEILRGPQGLLFGKNVTGGAVVLRTTTPAFEYSSNFRARVETGLNYIVSGVVTGPLSDNLAGKIAAYYSHDDGWFRNKFDGSSLGRSEQIIFRPAFRFEPSSAVTVDLKLEHGEVSGDGATFQNNALFKRGSFDISNDYRGYNEQRRTHAILEVNAELGSGTLTGIAGYRDFEMDVGFDVDGTPTHFFHFTKATIRQEQVSAELRYAASLGALDITLGTFYFDQDLEATEERAISNNALVVSGGGEQKTETYAVFGFADWQLTDTVTVNIGGRYTWERKSAVITRIQPNGCNFPELTCVGGFEDSEKWGGFTPKLGLQWKPSDLVHLYGFFTSGFRSGGYNVRHSAVDADPGPYGDEKTDTVELGSHLDLGPMSRLSAAVFYNKISDMQREVQFPTETSVAQLIKNTADATLWGFEVEGQTEIFPNLVISASVEYVNGKYDKVLFDLSGDGAVNDTDLNLKIPRLVPWTYGAAAAYSHTLKGIDAELIARVSFEHRDLSFQTDNNRATLPGSDWLDASLTLSLRDQIKLSVFGRNILGEATFSNNSPLPAAFGGTGANGATINKGRIIGAEASYRF